MTLQVWRDAGRIGTLESTADRGIVFEYATEYLESPRARAVSISLPLQPGRFPQAKCLPFFAGLLPDGDLRRRIADHLHISEHSSLKLLEALGGECAGAIRMIRADGDDRGPSPVEGAFYEEIPLEELERMMLDSPRPPLLLPREGVRLSLAGAQDKIPLYRRDGRWFRPHGGLPTNYILKPSSSAFPEMAVNEFIALRLAGMLGLPVPEADLQVFGVPVLTVRRYDRSIGNDGSLARIHQEDFCQATGIMPDRKYQSDGGPDFAVIADMIRNACAFPVQDLERLVAVALFNILIGNCDAHGKNFSMVHGEGATSLAPFYDLVSTTFWKELDTRMSMRFGGVWHIDAIGKPQLTVFARDIGVRPALVDSMAGSMMDAAESAWSRVSGLPELTGQGVVLDTMQKGWMQRAAGLRR